MGDAAARPEPSATSTVLGRGSVYTVATAAPALAAVAVIPAVTRALPVHEYDLVAVCTVIVQVGSILVALGMGLAVTRQYLLAAGGAAGARGLVLRGAALATVSAGVLGALMPWWSPALLGRPASVEVVLAVVASLGGAWAVLAQSFLRGADRPVPFVAVAAVASLGGPVAGLGAVALVGATALPYLASVAAAFVLAGVMGVGLVVASGRKTGTWSEMRTALRIGVPTIPHQISLYLALAGLVVVADRTLGAGGRANVALMIGAGATVVTAGLNNAWAPLVFRTPPADRGRVLSETTRAIVLVTLALAGSVALLSPWILQVAAPAAYRTNELVPAVAIAAGAAVPSVLYLASSHLVFVSGRTGGLALTTPVAVGLGLGWAVAVPPGWDVTGIASGYLVTYVALALLTTGLQRRLARPPWSPPPLVGVALAWVAVTVAGAVLPTTGVPGAAARIGGTVLVVGAALGRLAGRRISRR